MSLFNPIRGLVLASAFCSGISVFAQGNDKDTAYTEPDIVFKGTRMAEKEEEFDTTGRLDVMGYASFYYAHYTDSLAPGAYQKFPTISPVSNAFSINLLQVSARYKSDRVRGILTLHWGDIASSVWSPQYNLIQQANMGIRLHKRLWMDVGFFRTHFGLESIQPRENINSSMAITTYFEPYYLSGAKLTWKVNDYFSVQVNTFNSFNGFVETNHKKALGFSAAYEKNGLTLSYNTQVNDDSPDQATRTLKRWYNNFYLVYKHKKLTLGYETNVGFQQHTRLSDTTRTAYMIGGLLALKYNINKKVSVYTREEFFYDPDEMLTGQVLNAAHSPIGLETWGTDLGVEIKPISNSYFRIECRRLQNVGKDEDIFYYNGSFRTYRWEFMLSTGVWF